MHHRGKNTFCPYYHEFYVKLISVNEKIVNGGQILIMIITSTGFFNTGSSAITHIIKEFDVVSNESDVYEIRLLYDPYGISDLEYNLVENPHRQNTSYAIQRFKKYIAMNSNILINHHYEKLCKGNFRKISYDYINSITEFEYFGPSHIDTFDKGIFFIFINRIYQKIIRILLKCGIKNIRRRSLLSQKTIQYAGTYNLDKFISSTQDYLKKIFYFLNNNDKEFILIDQLIPPTNMERYIRYLPKDEDVRIFVVDRDPRDLYVTCKYFLKVKTIPCSTPEIFCEWFEWTRGQSFIKKDPSCVMRIQFEDLIYNYELTRGKILKFCGLEELNCFMKKKIFIPEMSISNTQVWLRYPDSIKDVEYIYKRLKKYCFNFENYKTAPNFKKNMFDC